MAITVIDDFNSYSNGDLNGQGSWSVAGGGSAAAVQVEGTTVQEGAKAVQLNSSSGGADSSHTKTITARTSGIMGHYVRANAATGDFCMLVWREGTTNIAQLQMRPSGSEVRLTVGASENNIGTYGTGTWYLIECEIDQAGDQVRARFNGGSWSSWISISFTQIDSVRIDPDYLGPGSGFFIDYLYHDDQASSSVRRNLMSLGVGK